MLRDDLVALLLKMRGDDGLQCMRYWHNRGAIVEHTCDLSFADRSALANYATQIANLTYQALGDHRASGGKSDEPAGGVAANTPSITVILPGAVGLPRPERTENSVFDLRDAPAIEAQCSIPLELTSPADES